MTAGVVTISATSSKDVTLVGTYTINCAAADTHSNSNSFAFTLALSQNSAPVVANAPNPSTVTVLIDTNHIKVFTGICTDPDSDTVTYSVKVGTTSYTDETDLVYKYNASTSTFTFVYNNVAS